MNFPGCKRRGRPPKKKTAPKEEASDDGGGGSRRKMRKLKPPPKVNISPAQIAELVESTVERLLGDTNGWICIFANVAIPCDFYSLNIL